MTSIGRGMAAAAFGLLLPAGLAAQDVKYTEATKIEAFVSLPGNSGPTKSTTYVSKGRIRSDTDGQSTILDYPGGAFTQMDHGAKTFYTLTFADLMASAEKMMADARVQMGQAQQQRQARQEPQPQQPEVKLEFDLKVERLGDGGPVSGYATERVMLVLKAKATSTQPDPETGEEVSGTLVFASDMWVSKDFPGFKAVQEAQQAAVNAISAEAQRQMQEFAESGRQMMASAPGIQGGGGMERMAEEMKKIDGTPLKSLTYQLMLPDSVEFDRDAVLAMADKPIPSFSLGAAMGAAAKQSARDALRGGLGGLLGRKKEEPRPAEAAAAPGQMVFMRITSTIEDVSTGAIPDDVFKPGAGYKEIKPDWMKSTGG